MRIAVTGGRDYTDQERLYAVLDALSPTEVAHGGARGADSLAGRWARERGVLCRVYEARWTGYARRWAGHVRNGFMLDDFRTELLVVFTGDRGTRNCLSQAQDREIPYLLACSERAVRALSTEDPRGALLLCVVA